VRYQLASGTVPVGTSHRLTYWPYFVSTGHDEWLNIGTKTDVSPPSHALVKNAWSFSSLLLNVFYLKA